MLYVTEISINKDNVPITKRQLWLNKWEFSKPLKESPWGNTISSQPMFKVNMSIRIGILFFVIISRSLPEPKVFFNTNDQIKCVGYECQGKLSLTQRFIVQRFRPWLLHPTQQLRNRHLGSVLIKGIGSHRKRDWLMSLTCWNNDHLGCTKPQLEVKKRIAYKQFTQSS